MGRGRPTKLQDRQTTCISLEKRHREYLLRHNLEASQNYRDYLDQCIQSEESPIEQLKREVIEHRRIAQENELLALQKEERIKQIENLEIETQIKQKEAEEAEIKRREYVSKYKHNLMKTDRCSKLWLDHLLEAYKFENYTDAKEYVKSVWIEDGVPEARAKAFLGIK